MLGFHDDLLVIEGDLMLRWWCRPDVKVLCPQWSAAATRCFDPKRTNKGPAEAGPFAI
jgi:hypothetical protein